MTVIVFFFCVLEMIAIPEKIYLIETVIIPHTRKERLRQMQKLLVVSVAQ